VKDRPRRAGGPEPERFRARREAEVGPNKIDPTLDIVGDMIELAVDARTITTLGRDRFFAEDEGRLLRHAADAIVVKFQEMCERLPQATRDRHPEVPWNEIRGSRNRLGHHYRGTDYRIIWTAIERDIIEAVDDMRSELT
jgi:uncharacterized protein with HEPN domain